MEALLTEQRIRELIEAATAARARAYAPYSRFNVGAAVLGADNQIYLGCNVENASFGLTICAERVAVTNAVAHGCREFVALAVVAETDSGPVTPCGACRQVLAEFSPHLTVICADGKNPPQIIKLDDLLPHRFEFGPRREA